MKKLIISIFCFGTIATIQAQTVSQATIMNNESEAAVIMEYMYAETENNMIKVRWGTLQEQNFGYFLVEKSMDGHHYHQIGKLEGNLYTYNSTGYEFIDELPMNGLNFYRMTAVGNNGSVTVFGPVGAKVETKEEVVAYSTDGKMNIRSSVPVATLKLIDEKGNEYKPDQISEYTFIMDNLPEGKYTLKAEDLKGKESTLRIRHN